VFSYTLERSDDWHSRLRISIRGRWTMTWLPNWLIHLWLRWVMAKVKHTVEIRLLRRELR
jgi:hypothetical protein